MRFSFYVLSLACLFFIFSSQSRAQSGQTGIAIPITIPDNPESGVIVCTGKAGYTICETNYSTAMFGVITTSPAAAFESAPQPNRHLVLKDGRALVRVSGRSGAIKVGDLVTSSVDAGIAQRANKNGYVLGTALDEFAGTSAEDVGVIAVSINIHPTTSFIDVRSNLLEALREGLAAPVLTPLAALRYILAAFVTVASFLMGFIYFGRLAKTGIEAIGRNPLARLQIQSSVLVNLILMAVIFGGGMALSYFILVL